MVFCALWQKSKQKEIGDCLRSYTLVDVDVLRASGCEPFSPLVWIEIL